MTIAMIEVVYLQVAADSFPPFVASTATSIIYGLDRCAWFVAPPMFESLRSRTGQFQMLFQVIVFLMIIAFVLVLCVPVLLQPYGGDNDVDPARSSSDSSDGAQWGNAGAMLVASK